MNTDAISYYHNVHRKARGQHRRTNESVQEKNTGPTQRQS